MNLSDNMSGGDKTSPKNKIRDKSTNITKKGKF